MAINSLFVRSVFLTLAAIAGLASFAEAQGYAPQQDLNYFLDPNSEEPRFMQRFSWIGGEYTLRYEIIIERREGRSYRRALQEFTTETFIEVSLKPGHYRFCVTPYDLLDRPADSTDWVNVEVRNALNPTLIDSSQELIKEEKKSYLYLDVYADNIDPEAEIYLRASNGRIIGPKEIEFFDDGGFRLCYDSSILKSGEYEVYVKNPGGLEASLGIIYIEPESNLKINIGASYMPVFKISGDAPSWNMAITGAALRISAVYNFSAFFIGPELTASFYMNPGIEQTITLEEEQQDQTVTEQAAGQTLGAQLSLLVGKMTPNQKTSFNIRFGGSYNIILGQEEIQSFISVNVGISFFWRIMKHFFMETGVDYNQLLNDDRSGFMRPWIGLGVQF